MTYRRTAKMQTRIEAKREAVIEAARRLVGEAGYAEAGMPAVAALAGVSIGALYRHFPSKAALFGEVFRRVSEREIAVFATAAAIPGDARTRLSRAIEAFAQRALRNRRLAQALLVDSIGPEIDADRRRLREPYRAIIEAIVRAGTEAGEIGPQDPSVTATAIVGAIVETMLGPLGRSSEAPRDADLVRSLVRVCVHALGPEPRPAQRENAPRQA